MSTVIHLFPDNPYVTASLSSPCSVAHKVWILDCKGCNTFLTNRAMRVVLLLLPSISLYSSDALPVNCSPSSDTHTPNLAATSSSFQTCECLTQSLFCSGCGDTIGYMIVIACTRCTESVAVKNRATNGHRFVFYSSKVVAAERHYIKDEPGIAFEHRSRSRTGDAHIPTTEAENLSSSFGEKLFINGNSSTIELQPGDVICWHHLEMRGEMPRIKDDNRGRSSIATNGCSIAR